MGDDIYSRVAVWMRRLGTETAFEVLARAKELEAQGKSVIHLEIGEPDFDTPQNIIDSAKKALDDGFTHYGPSQGIPKFREVLAEYITKTRGVKTSPSQIVVTPGAKPVIFYAVMALVEPNDEVIYPNPGYPIYESVINFIGAKAVPLPIREENDFRVDLDEFKKLISNKTKMIILNSPHNPTSGVLSKEDLKAIADVCLERKIWVVSDEVYCKILYEGEFNSIYSFDGMKDQMILVDGASKTYAMTGWRLGFGVMPEDIAFHITRLVTNSVSHTASFIQVAGIEAFVGPQDKVVEFTSEFKRRRDVIVGGLNEIPGYTCHLPKGAFYVFPNIKNTGFTSRELQSRLLEEAGVACLSGASFGQFGEGYLRFSYANSIDNIKEALKRIKEFHSKI
ncbi:MAG: pyridoxal phosphate-dependent aminotransferase [bacterium]